MCPGFVKSSAVTPNEGGHCVTTLQWVVVFIYCAIEFSVVNVVFSILKRLLHYISPMKERLS